jgi:hypothetical protein
MRLRNFPTLPSLALAFALFAPQVLLAQYAISTVAGGGPNNLTALSASIGYPGSIAFDTAGNVYIADSYSSHIFKVDTTGNFTVVAGNGTIGYSGDGGPATSAALNNPEGVFVDGSGNIFIADTDNCLIREVSGGNISTVAGNAALTERCGYAGDGGPATSAQLYDPFGIFVDGSGNIFIADTDNCLVREVTGGNISTVAGNPSASPSPCGYAGDGGVATSAQLDEPFGVFVDGTGNIFIADSGNNLIRVVNTTTAPITVAGVSIAAENIQTVAGAFYDSQGGTACELTGDGGVATSADLCSPYGIFVDSAGNIFIADTNNFAIREVAASTTDIITTVAGTLGVAGYSPNGTTATSADLNYPSKIVVDGSGNIYIADTDNFVIREVTAGAIQTVVGDNTLSYSGDGGLAVNAELSAPVGVALDASGNLYIADSDNSAVRKVTAASGDIQTVAGSLTTCASTMAACGDGGAATSAQLNTPQGVFLDASGNVFIADTEDNRIRAVNMGTTAVTIAGVAIQPGDIATVAGTGAAGYLGDGGLATSAELSNPYGVFVDSAENIFIADTGNNVIREVLSTGTIATIAGNGTQCTPATSACGDGSVATSAQLSSPTGVFVDAAENVYIADAFDNRIRAVNTTTQSVTVAGTMIAAGDIATVAGTGTRGYAGDGAAAASAELDTPYGLFVDASGNIFIADTENAAIREVVASTGFIQTVAGTLLTPGFSGDGGQSTSAELNSPSGLFGNSANDLFLADTGDARIRELVPAIFVTVTPNPVNVAVSTQQQFMASVTGTSNTAVTWYVNGVVGGNSTLGTITMSGLFQAPATIPTPATVTISAISQADNTTSGSAQATIVATGDAVAVTVSTSPAISQIYTTTTQQFIATVTGTTETGVTWQVNGVTGGNGTVGTINSSGLYTAPAAVPSPATVTIEAISQALSSAVGTESVTIVTEPSAAQPAPQTASPGGTATYSLLLNENTGAPGAPITLSCSQSSLPLGGTCSFSPARITPGAQAVPFSLTITIPSGSSSVADLRGMRVRFYAVLLPLAGIFLVGIGGRSKRRRWLWPAAPFVFLALLTACAGSGSSTNPLRNPELGTYNVKVEGATNAQPNPVTITIVGLTVQ